MKFPLLLAAGGVFCGPLLLSGAGQQTPNAPTPGAPELKVRENLPEHRAHGEWNVSVDVQMVALPQDLALKLLPDLQSNDATKIEHAVQQIQELLRKKEVTLLGWPRAVARIGVKANSETVREKLYPSEFEVPREPQTFSIYGNVIHVPFSLVPKSLEERNLETSVELEPVAVDENRQILLRLLAQRNDLAGSESYELGTTRRGDRLQLDQLEFLTAKSETFSKIPSGGYLLLGVHSGTVPKNGIELFIARAVATRFD